MSSITWQFFQQERVNISHSAQIWIVSQVKLFCQQTNRVYLTRSTTQCSLKGNSRSILEALRILCSVCQTPSKKCKDKAKWWISLRPPHDKPPVTLSLGLFASWIKPFQKQAIKADLHSSEFTSSRARYQNRENYTTLDITCQLLLCPAIQLSQFWASASWLQET